VRLTLVAVGRLRKGPERELTADYLARACRTGRRVGLTDTRLSEVEARGRAGPSSEADALRRAVPDGAVTVCLDERGRQLSSPELAASLAAWRDGGRRDVAFLVGGADGLEPALVAGADLSLSLGPMVWPHLLARVMLAEQLYRAASILAGTPYHRN
jgi:23S rRNA (pseudouridine1915-N3)-methyltransferase